VKNFTKSRQEYTRADGHSNSRGRQRVKSWVRPWWNRTLAPLGASGLAGGGESNVHKGLQGARRGQSWHRRLKRSHKGVVRATASNLDTLLDRGFGRRVRMLLSFQRPSHPFRKVVLHKRRVRNPNRIPRVASPDYEFIRTIILSYQDWVVPFGDPRIKACLRLPVAYRNLLRP
jgi:hypothetical protein